MFTVQLDRIERESGSNLLVNAVHPGVVATKLFQHVAWVQIFPLFARFLFKTPKQGSDTVVYAALSSEVKDGGNYYENCTVTQPSRLAKDPNDLIRLWNLSLYQVDIKKFGGCGPPADFRRLLSSQMTKGDCGLPVGFRKLWPSCRLRDIVAFLLTSGCCPPADFRRMWPFC
ncbi:hypothetical protein SK128_006130 [Halocaridina rubra]|uniref:Retinol dehydrogenase 14 n=1 Tax=Halocaridina rubra TaxID=373956 RepID=A0AAN9A392_HALRR